MVNSFSERIIAKKMLAKPAILVIVPIILLSVLWCSVYASDDVSVFQTNTISINADFPQSSELFKGYVQKTLYPKNMSEANPTSVEAREQLGANDKNIYDFLKNKIEKVANGEISSTTFKINKDAFDKWGFKNSWTAEELGIVKEDSESENQYLQRVGNAAFREFNKNFNTSQIISAILADCPYDLYWFDKSKTGGIASGGYTLSDNRIEFYVDCLIFSFRVAKNYKAENYNQNNPEVDVAKTSAALNAANYAKEIVEKYKNLPDYQKLKAYRDVICELTLYNTDAAENNIAYGDEWQIIYVFDKNNKTNVVCEGYSKAFQYLFDLSTFENDIKCYTVTGVTSSGSGAGDHMWNIVKMEDGKSYLVDVTNSDTGSIGQRGDLFLAGTAGSINSGYRFTIDAYNSIKYYFSDSSINLWGTDEKSILNLSGTNYAYDKKVTPSGSYKNDLEIEKTYGGLEKVNVKITSKSGKSVPALKVYIIVYNSDGKIASISTQPYKASSQKTDIPLNKPALEENQTYKIFVWTDDTIPLLSSINDLKAF
ncbi:MAG: hypothetical protein SPF92_07080 [Clostridia bacterium]|nr:hypothetical protein [Clostridia bacterium]